MFEGIQVCFGFGLSDVHVVKVPIFVPNEQFSFSAKIINPFLHRLFLDHGIIFFF